MVTPFSLFIIFLLIPAIWSGLVQAIRQIAAQKSEVLSDNAEKTVLAVMLSPVAAGLIFLLISPFSRPLAQSHIFYPPAFDEVTQITTRALPKLAPQGPDLIALGAGAIFVTYLVGLLISLSLVGQAHYRLSRIVKTAQPTSAGPHILCTELSSPAFAWGRQSIIVPSTLFERLSASELDLILAHERAHQRRGDPLYFLGLSLIEALFWFNPLFARQARACRLAAELACDAAVTGEGTQSRKAYAKTLILALKHSSDHGVTFMPTLLSDKNTYKLRLTQILSRSSRPRKASLSFAAMFGLAAPMLMLQMAFAEGHSVPVITAIAAVAPVESAGKSNALFHTAPVDAPVTQGFGPRKDPWTGKPSFHTGVDFQLPVGTPVRAPAAGTVTSAAEQGKYGLTVEIDQGNAIKTRYAHLDKLEVREGDHVSEGQVIALSGNTGLSTGPHLHFEVWQNGKTIDPTMAAGLKTQ